MTNNKSIKVVFFVPNFVVGGVENVFVNTLNELLKGTNLDISIVTHIKVREPLYVDWLKSHPEIHVYTYFPLGHWFQNLEPKCRGILKLVRKITFSLYKRYRRFICRNRFKNMDVFIDYKNFEFYREFSYIKKPKIAWAHSALSYFEQDKKFLKKTQEYNKIVCLTDDFMESFKEKYPEYADKIVRIYNPIDAEQVRQKSLQENSPKGKYFCHVSRLDYGKDIKTLLDAFDIFYKSHKDVKLYIVGDGSLAKEHKDYAKTLEASKNIIFTGTQYNPYVLMKGAVANILSTDFEGLPTVVLESVALGVPCISSNCKSGPNEILLGGKGGLLFEIGNAKMLAEKMTSVFLHPDTAQKLADEASKGLTRFDPRGISTQIKELIYGMVKGR
jgi:glycosyltransferase involved in cell wall biosynthesis